MSSLTLPHRNGMVTLPPSHPWLQTSVQKFFAGINWDANSPEVQELRSTAQVNAGPLSLTLSVGQFFAAVDWHGSTVAGPASLPPTTPTLTTDDLTLEDFSGLF